MSGHVGLREEARLGHLLARRIARLFPRPLQPVTVSRWKGLPWR
ncbi:MULTISPECIES: hypothetical protein [unclassified Pseudomonas]|nr:MULTISPECIES: hypothetical protein [unclassified Pseudomonas]MDG9926309.1 hypothetical protein [Pseudomonas sp. GD04045]MDH0034199.1 hypothetical protein [Pseudomonas sp. GD04019]